MSIGRPGVACTWIRNEVHSATINRISRVIPVHKLIKYTLVCEAILFSPGGEELFPCVRGISYERRLEFYDEKFRSRQSYIICKAYTLAKE